MEHDEKSCFLILEHDKKSCFGKKSYGRKRETIDCDSMLRVEVSFSFIAFGSSLPTTFFNINSSTGLSVFPTPLTFTG